MEIKKKICAKFELRLKKLILNYFHNFDFYWKLKCLAIKKQKIIYNFVIIGEFYEWNKMNTKKKTNKFVPSLCKY